MIWSHKAKKKHETFCEESLTGYVHISVLFKIGDIFLRSISQLASILWYRWCHRGTCWHPVEKWWNQADCVRSPWCTHLRHPGCLEVSDSWDQSSFRVIVYETCISPISVHSLSCLALPTYSYSVPLLASCKSSGLSSNSGCCNNREICNVWRCCQPRLYVKGGI